MEELVRVKLQGSQSSMMPTRQVPQSGRCTLIVTEGDSAKTLAVAGLSVVGRDHYGVFPLRGKCKNVRDASVAQLTSNQEFNDLKKILGLQQGKDYQDVSELRYG